MPIAEEVDTPELHKILGRSTRLNMTTAFGVLGYMDASGLRLTTEDDHVNQMMQTFYRTHNREMRILPIQNGDVVLMNGQPMEKGFNVPLLPNQTVVFSRVSL